MGRGLKILVAVNTLILMVVLLFTCSRAAALEDEDVVGNWECENFPAGLLTELGIKDTHFTCKIEIRKDRSFKVVNLPVRSPYKVINLKGKWEIKPGKITPSGKDSLYLDGNFLTGKKKIMFDHLQYIVSGKDGYKLIFSRRKKP